LEAAQRIIAMASHPILLLSADEGVRSQTDIEQITVSSGYSKHLVSGHANVKLFDKRISAREELRPSAIPTAHVQMRAITKEAQVRTRYSAPRSTKCTVKLSLSIIGTKLSSLNIIKSTSNKTTVFCSSQQP
jgi:hypothetical protein